MDFPYTCAVRKLIEFLGANLFLLAILLIGLAAFSMIGMVIKALAPDPDAVPWAWAIAVAVGIAAMGYGGRWLHRWLARLIGHSTARSRSGARPGVY